MAAVCAYCDRFQLGEFTGTVFCNEDCEAAYTRIRTAAEAETVASIVSFIEAKAAKGCGYRHATYGDACAHCEYERSLESIAEQIRDGDWKPSASGGG